MLRTGVRHVAALAVLAVLAGCGGDNTTTPGAITLSLSSGTAAVTQGQSATVNVTVTRTNFGGDVSLTADGAPTGVTASFDPATLGGSATASTLTIAAAAGAATGTSTITVHAQGTGVTAQTATIALTVTSSGAFTISVDPTTLSVDQGANGNTTVTVARTGTMNGAVALTATGLPTGVTATFDPTSVAAGATTSTLTLSVGAGVAAGTTNISIKGTSAGFPDQTASVALTVTQPTAGNQVTLNFCSDEVPIWAAYQNPGGAWTNVAVTNQAITFTAATTKVGLVLVFEDASGNTPAYETDVAYLTTDDIAALGTDSCIPLLGTKTLNGSVAGLAAGDIAQVNIGGDFAMALANGPYQLTSVPDGTPDLVALRGSVEGTTLVPKAAIVRRGVNLASGGTIPVLDFSSGEAVPLDSAILTISGITAGEDVGAIVLFTTATRTAAMVGGGTLTTDTVTVYGLPASALVASDLYETDVVASGTNATRGVFSYSGTFGAATIALGPALSQPQVTVATTNPYVRMRLQLATQTEYDQAASLDFDQTAANRRGSVIMTAGYLDGAATWDLSMPDLSGASGWDPSWALQTGQPVTWDVTAAGGAASILLGAAPTAGAAVTFANASSDAGGITPDRILRFRGGRLAPTQVRNPRAVPDARRLAPWFVRQPSHARPR